MDKVIDHLKKLAADDSDDEEIPDPDFVPPVLHPDPDLHPEMYPSPPPKPIVSPPS